MTVRHSITWLLLVFAFLLPVGVAGAAPPNIVFILTDDQGYGDLSCHGHPILKTPNLDRLHGESVRFTDFHASPVCSPCRCALMTGRHEFRSGVSHTRGPRQRMDLKATTIAQVLQSAGYATGIFGKWHLGEDAPYWPNKRGFDESLIFLGGMMGEVAPTNGTWFDPTLLRNGAKEKTTGYSTDVFFGEATKWMAGVKGKKPFFAYIATNAPHVPVRCPEECEKLYADTAKDPKLARYYGAIANIDANVGRLLTQFKEWGIERDTLVIFMTDNGAEASSNGFYKGGTAPAQAFNAGMRGGKGTVYQGGTRVPFFCRWPAGFKGGFDVDRLASNIDLFPTLVELAGAKVPEVVKLDGRSLFPLLKDPKADWPDRFVFIHADNWGGKASAQKHAGSAVRSDGFSLVNNKELYDIKADPGETKNVIGEHPEIVAKMRAAYDRWWEEVLPVLESAKP